MCIGKAFNVQFMHILIVTKMYPLIMPAVTQIKVAIQASTFSIRNSMQRKKNDSKQQITLAQLKPEQLKLLQRLLIHTDIAPCASYCSLWLKMPDNLNDKFVGMNWKACPERYLKHMFFSEPLFVSLIVFLQLCWLFDVCISLCHID